MEEVDVEEKIVYGKHGIRRLDAPKRRGKTCADWLVYHGITKRTPPEIRELILLRDGLVCRYCQAQLDPEHVTLDHLLPLSRGGDHSPDNLCVSCYACNNLKGDMDLAEFLAFLSKRS